MEPTFLPVRGKGGCWALPARGTPADDLRAASARMLVAEASEQRLDGQVFWLTAHTGLGTAFPP